MGARMVPANGRTTKTKKIFYMSFWLERLSIFNPNTVKLGYIEVEVT